MEERSSGGNNFPGEVHGRSARMPGVLTDLLGFTASIEGAET